MQATQSLTAALHITTDAYVDQRLRTRALDLRLDCDRDVRTQKLAASRQKTGFGTVRH